MPGAFEQARQRAPVQRQLLDAGALSTAPSVGLSTVSIGVTSPIETSVAVPRRQDVTTAPRGFALPANRTSPSADSASVHGLELREHVDPT
jgi:hypothetical protein